MSADDHRIGLADAIEALHLELRSAIERAGDRDFHFPVGSVDLEFYVGITRSADAKGGVKFWVVELGGGGSYARETIQRVKLTLQGPVDEDGNPVLVGRPSAQKP